jgi:hypothetical protein
MFWQPVNISRLMSWSPVSAHQLMTANIWKVIYEQDTKME